MSTRKSSNTIQSYIQGTGTIFFDNAIVASKFYKRTQQESIPHILLHKTVDYERYERGMEILLHQYPRIQKKEYPNIIIYIL
jgi:hypothetical protein